MKSMFAKINTEYDLVWFYRVVSAVWGHTDVYRSKAQHVMKVHLRVKGEVV